MLVVPTTSAKRERFESSSDGAAPANAPQGAAATQPIRWETEVDVPDVAACELPIHLN